jgi:hypothetical protein
VTGVPAPALSSRLTRISKMSAIEHPKADGLLGYWLMAGVIGASAGALAALALWVSLLPGVKSPGALGLYALPPLAVAIAQAAVLYRVAPKLAMATAWVVATLLLFVLAQVIAMLGFMSGPSMSPTKTAQYFAAGTIPGAALLGFAQREMLKAWRLRPKYWIVATIVGNVVGVYLLLGIGVALDAVAAGDVLACCKYQDRLTVTLAGPIISAISVVQAFSLWKVAIAVKS